MLLIFAAILITYVFVLSRLISNANDNFDRHFLSLSLTFLILLFVSHILVRLNIFSINTLSAALVIIILLLTFISLKFIPHKNNYNFINYSMIKYISIYSTLIILLLYYFMFPTYYLLGGRDPGLYLIYAVHIGKSGGLNLDLPILRELHAQFGSAIKLGYPGIYSAFERGLSNDPARLIPQFMHLFSSFGAIAYKIAGIEGAIRANGLIAVFALWSFFMVARRFVGFYFALFAMLALGLNAAFIWNARITLTESLNVALLFTGVFYLILSFERRSQIWAIISGSVLGLSILNRLDGSLNVLIILGVLIFCGSKKEYFKIVALPLTISYLVASSIGFIDGYLHSFPYLQDLWRTGGLKPLVLLNYSLPILGLTVYFLSIKLLSSERKREVVLSVILKIAVILLFMWVIFDFCIWTRLGYWFYAKHIKELAWYLTPVLYVLFLLGLWKSSNNKNKWSFFIPLMIITISTFFIFTWRPNIAPDHIWASRRWVSHVIPLIIFFSFIFLDWFYSTKLNKSIKIGFITIIIGYYIANSIWMAKPYLFTSIYDHSKIDYDLLQSNLEKYNKRLYLLSNNSQISSIITYILGYDVVLVSENGLKLIENGELKNGIYLLGFYPSINRKLIENLHIGGDYLEIREGSKPRKLYKRIYNATITVSGKGKVIYHPTDQGFGTRVGVKDYQNRLVTSGGERGLLVYGPYIPVPPGRYKVSWFGKSSEVLNGWIGFVDIACDKGKNVIKREPLQLASFQQGNIVDLEFELSAKCSDLEFRFYINNGVTISIDQIVIEQADGGPIELNRLGGETVPDS